jgi:hypothetical protein
MHGESRGSLLKIYIAQTRNTHEHFAWFVCKFSNGSSFIFTLLMRNLRLLAAILGNGKPGLIVTVG